MYLEMKFMWVFKFNEVHKMNTVIMTIQKQIICHYVMGLELLIKICCR
jgi:hypothetical protein